MEDLHSATDLTTEILRAHSAGWDGTPEQRAAWEADPAWAAHARLYRSLGLLSKATIHPWVNKTGWLIESDGSFYPALDEHLDALRGVAAFCPEYSERIERTITDLHYLRLDVPGLPGHQMSRRQQLEYLRSSRLKEHVGEAGTTALAGFEVFTGPEMARLARVYEDRDFLRHFGKDEKVHAALDSGAAQVFEKLDLATRVGLAVEAAAQRDDEKLLDKRQRFLALALLDLHEAVKSESEQVEDVLRRAKLLTKAEPWWHSRSKIIVLVMACAAAVAMFAR